MFNDMRYLYVEFQPKNERSAPAKRKCLQISLWAVIGTIAAAVLFLVVSLTSKVISLLIRLRRDGVLQIYKDMRRR